MARHCRSDPMSQHCSSNPRQQERACLALVTYFRHSATGPGLGQPLENGGSVQLVVRFPGGRPQPMSNGERAT